VNIPSANNVLHQRHCMKRRNDYFGYEKKARTLVLFSAENSFHETFSTDDAFSKSQISDNDDDDEWAKLEKSVGRPMPSLEEQDAETQPLPSQQKSNEQQQPHHSNIEAPSVSKIINFAIPAVGIWLCSPLLSLIDTSAVGLLSGTAQQAALNPAVSVTDYGGLLVAFMYTATTNLVAAAQGIDSNNNTNNRVGSNHKDKSSRTTKTFITALQLSFIVGISFGSFLGIFGGPILRLLMGTENIDPTVFSAALRYVQIRALGMPAAVVIGSSQSACLGMQDVRSPLYVLIAAALVNFIGDILFVRNSNPWIGGAAGAAWATTISQYVALFLFLKWLQFKPRRIFQRQNIAATGERPVQFLDNTFDANSVNDDDIADVDLESTADSTEVGPKINRLGRVLRKSISSRSHNDLKSKTSSASIVLQKIQSSFLKNKKMVKSTKMNHTTVTTKQSSPKSRGFLHGHFKASDLFRWSRIDKRIAREFQPFVIPVTISSVGRISGYIAMSHVASSALGTFDMAAQQVVFSFFCCLTPLVDALSQTAQSFVPTIFETPRSLVRTAALKKTYNNFFKAGGIFGSIILGLVTFIPFLSRFFTNDLSVIAKVHGAIPGLMAFFAFGGLMCVGEGMLLGQKDLKFLGRMYGAYFFIVPYIMLRLKKRALLGIQDVTIGTMWGVFSIYQCIRVAIWHVRLKLLQRKTERDTLALSAEQS